MVDDARAALAVAQQQLVSLLVQGERTKAVDAFSHLWAHGDSAHEAVKALTQRGLQVYHANTAALAERALGAAYPVFAELLGPENFSSLSRLFWRAHPPCCGDMARWGAALADWVEQQPQLVDSPFLADVARVEWALHQSAGAADADADVQSFQCLVTQDPNRLTLQLAPGVACVASAWPVVSLVQAHDPFSATTLAQAAARLQLPMAENALMWRQGFRPQLREALCGEPEFVSDLLAGVALGQALTSHPALDFSAWLPLAAGTGLLLRVSRAV